MGKAMEAVFCVICIIYAIVMGILILKNSKKVKEYVLFGIMSLVLVFGDSFHLIPRIIVAIDPKGDYHTALGLGKLITSITMTFFYVILYFIYEIRYKYKNNILRYSFIALALIRIALCLFPQNDWTGDAPVLWGVYRNIPFTIMGIIIVVMFFLKRSDKFYKWMWLAITFSFGFYIPVVLLADKYPLVGMLMLPKTIMYMWVIFMGFKVVKKEINQISK